MCKCIASVWRSCHFSDEAQFTTDVEDPNYMHIILFYHTCLDDPLQIMNMRTIRPDEIAQGDLNLVSNTERIKSSQESPCKEQNDPLYEKVSPHIKQVVIADSASDEIKRNLNLSEPQLTNDNDTKIALDPAYQKLSQYQGSIVICNGHNENESEI